MEKEISCQITTKLFNFNAKNEDSLYVQLLFDNKLMTQQQNDFQKQYLIMIDRSGSMGGSRIENTKKVTYLLIEHLLLTQKNCRISIITFDTKITEYMDLQTLTHQQIKQLVDNIDAGGGTIFCNAFQGILNYIQLQKPQNFTLLLLTDGEINDNQDTKENGKYLNTIIQQLQLCSQKYITNFEVHTIGLGSDHNPFILDQIINLKTSRGTYQFIKEPSDIEISFEAIKDTMMEAFIELKLINKKLGTNITVGLEQQQKQVNEKENNEVQQFNGLVQLQDLIQLIDLKDQAGQQTIEQIIQENEQNLIFQVFRDYKLIDTIPYQQQGEPIVNDLDFQKLAQLNIICKSSEDLIKQLKTKIMNKIDLTQQEINQFNEQYLSVKQQSQKLLKQIFRLKNQNQKDTLLKKYAQLSENLVKSEECFNAFLQHNIKNELIAELNALQHTAIKNKVFQKRMQKRTKGSTIQFNEYEIQLKKKSLEFKDAQKELLAKYEKYLDEIGTCFLTCYNFVEAIADEDCLCITFSVKRTELAIVRPESLEIVSIFPTLISAKSFISSVQYALNISPEKSGGFNKMEGQIIKGVAQEYINAAIPIFISPEHWAMGKLWLEPILGWVVTLSSLGYHHTQKRTVPFLVLVKIFEELIKNQYQSEFLVKYFDQMSQTCVSIMQEIDQDKTQLQIEESKGLDLQSELVGKFKDFFTGPEYRIPDVVTNIKVFLSQIYCGLGLNWLKFEDQQKKTQFFLFAIEEQLRRNDNNIWQINELKQLFQSDINKPVFLKALKQYRELIQKECNFIFAYRGLLEKMNGKQITDILDIKQDEQIIKLLELPNETAFKCLFIQNQLQKIDRVRKNQISIKEYFNPYQDYQQFFNFFEKFANQQEQEIQQHYQKLNKKQRIRHIGNQRFTCPQIPNHLQYEVNNLINSDKKQEWKDLLDSLISKKKNIRWYFWLLVSKEKIDLIGKLKYIKSQLGSFQFIKPYHVYLLNKQGIMNSGEINSLQI